MNCCVKTARVGRRAWPLIALLALAGCQSRPPIAVVPRLDVDRFMGSWYVIACIPTFIERNAFAAVESYERAPDGSIRTTFTFRAGAFDGPLKRYTPTGWVVPGSNGAVWEMQFIWPIRSDYRVMFIDPDYQLTLIGRNRRDYAWIMARTPHISPEQFAQMTALLREAGYDEGALRRVPQQP
jgi:apolipoprotein D and lipocalin family protein